MWDTWLEASETLGARGDEHTLRRGEWVAKVRPPLPRIARLARTAAAVPWSGFGRLSDGRALALRRFVDGTILADSNATLATAMSLAVAVRDLHDQGIVHGDLQPRNIVVAPDGAVRLIDIAVWLEPLDAPGRVAGSAPYMSPELWTGAPPTPESDRYALAAVLAESLTGRRVITTAKANDLAGWARAHREGPRPIDGIDDELVAGTLNRMLAADPSARATLQDLIDALASAGVPVPVTHSWWWPSEYASFVETIAETVDAGSSVTLRATRSEGRVEAFVAAVDALELRGRRVVALRGRDVVRPAPLGSEHDGPWAPARALVDAARWHAGQPRQALDLRHGDRLHVFETLTQALRDACAGATDRGGPTVVAWEDPTACGPDILDWLEHLGDAAARDPELRARLAFFIADEQPGVGIEMSLPTIEWTSWRRWRAQTLRAEVRDISEGRFEELLDDYGHGFRALLDAVDREIGARSTATSRDSGWNTARLIRVGDAWKADVDRLLDERAFGSAVEMCSGLWQAIRFRRTVDDHMRTQVLEAWVDGVIRGGLREEPAVALEQGLREAEVLGANLLLAQLLYKLGRHTDGLAVLDEAPATPEREAWRAQLALSSGQFDEAETAANRGIELLGDPSESHPADDEVALHLAVMQYAPRAIRGEVGAIEALRDLGPRLESAGVSPSLRARAHAYRAIGLNRRDELDDATDAYLRALEEIEGAGLDAEMPTYLLNVGTAYHRQGRLGLAREYYARGVRLSQSTTRASTRGLLLINQANIDLALGRLDEAASLIDRARLLGELHELRQVLVVCEQLEGDISLERGDPSGALDIWRAALRGDHLTLSSREHAELQLSVAEAQIALADERSAASALEAARRIIEEDRITDFEHHLGILRARLQWAEGSSLGTMAGIELFRRSLIGAQSAGNHRLVLRQAPYLIEQVEAEELGELRDEIADVVQSSRNAIAMGLTRELRADFFAQLPELSRRGVGGESTTAKPDRREQRATSHAVTASTNMGRDAIERFYRMLSLNEMILSSASLDALLETSLEIALSLSGAERGFVLLREADKSRVGDFKVAASRDIDGSPIPQPHLEVSLTIAEEAARTGRTVTTVNAREDQRFNQALSVVDLDLTSVVCVPVRDGSGLLGALYLDHRYQPGVFEGELPRMMEAFGHQVALAITNARRLRQLEHERERLSVANAKLDELLAEREAEVEGLARRVATLSEEIERQVGGLREAFPAIAFTSTQMERLLDQVRRVARGDVPVVVTGESGVGKELVASAIHDASPRRDGPFVALNCGAVSESLFESEMFGHVRGAFTGADIDRQGLIVAANGGTLFLDEVGEMPLSMQVKLLRVLQERRVRRVGATATEAVDVRVVAATNRDLREMVDEGTFREDLYYRLAAIVLEVPPLRDRREDIPLIAQSLLDRIDDEPRRLSPEAARILRRGRWKGNVRELENTLRAAAVLSDEAMIDASVIAPFVEIDRGDGKPSSGVRGPVGKVETRGRRRKATREDVVDALRRAGDDRDRAAELLGVSLRTMYRYLKRWDLYD